MILNAAMISSVTNSNQNNYESDATQTTSVTTSMDTENVPSKKKPRFGDDLTTSATTNTDTENVHSKKKLAFEDDLTTSVTTAVINTLTPNKEHLQFVDDILDITVEGEDLGSDMETTEILDSDDEFSMEAWSETKALNWPFNPLTESSCQTVGPLVQVTRFGDYPKYVLGGMCTQGRPPLSRRIKGDGNCYFRAVSFYLCGEEDYYADICKAVCDFISTFDDDLKPFIKKGKGKEYLLKSKMRDNGKWATETEILATAKILH